MNWWNLIWIIPMGLLYFMFLMVLFWQRWMWRKARLINANLYGNIVSDCVLCPVCKGYIYVNDWLEHLDDGHTDQVHFIKPIEQEFAEARARLAAPAYPDNSK